MEATPFSIKPCRLAESILIEKDGALGMHFCYSQEFKNVCPMERGHIIKFINP